MGCDEIFLIRMIKIMALDKETPSQSDIRFSIPVPFDPLALVSRRSTFATSVLKSLRSRLLPLLEVISRIPRTRSPVGRTNGKALFDVGSPAFGVRLFSVSDTCSGKRCESREKTFSQAPAV